MAEVVMVGTPEEANEFHTRWLGAAPHLLNELGIEVAVLDATDSFLSNGPTSFTKKEFCASVHGERVAVASLNLHRDHFGRAFQIQSHGTTATTACIGFGLDRIAGLLS
jgi:seryl-tRNA synthetase